MRTAQQAFGHGDRLTFEIADGLEIRLAEAFGRLADEGVHGQGGGNRGYAAAGQRGSGRQDVKRHPADDAVTPRPPPDALALAMQDVEGLAVQQLVSALIGVGKNIRDRSPAMHGLGPTIGLGPHQALKSLFSQHDPVSVAKDQRRAGRDQVEGVGQYEGSAVHAGSRRL